MTRPRWETVESVSLLLITLFFSAALLVNVRDWVSKPPFSKGVMLIGLLMTLLVMRAAIPLLMRPFRTLADRLYWTFLDYGKSAWRLLVLIFAMMVVSFILVATEPKNFEPTATAALAMKLAAKFEVPCQAEKNWGTAEAFWMTLRYHIPLVRFGIMDDCQPADGPLRLRYFVDKAGPPKWWADYIGRWPTGSDWFGLMALLNYILWPLFIPFLVQQIFRPDR